MLARAAVRTFSRGSVPAGPGTRPILHLSPRRGIDFSHLESRKSFSHSSSYSTLAATQRLKGQSLADGPLWSSLASVRSFSSQSTLQKNKQPTSNSPQDRAADHSPTQPEFDSSRQSKYTSRTRPTPGSAATKEDAASQEPDFSIQQPEFETTASSQRGKSPDVENAASPDQLKSDKAETGTSSTDQQPVTGDLPDLRHGIPATFEAEFADKSSSFKDKDAESPDLNLTADPAGRSQRDEREDARKEAYVSSIDRRRQQMARWLTYSFGVFAVVFAAYTGRNWEEGEEQLHPEAPNGWGIGLFYDRVKARMGSQLGYYTEPAFPKLLPDMDPQYKMPYTLVLSLEDLLVHSSWSRTKGWEVAKRPGVDYFLRYMSAYYELVIFTSVQSMNADLVIRKLDPYRIVSWPLFREATRYKNGAHVKDLSYLNRDLSKTLIIDTLPEHVQNQPENAIILPKWSGSAQDEHTKDLISLIPFLEYIATQSLDDVREVLKSYEGTNVAEEFARRERLAREAFNKRMEEEKKHRPRISGIGGLSAALGFKPTPMMQIPGELTPAEALAQGKMPSDQMRERGQRAYEQLEKQIRENGDEWLAEMEREEKKAQQEAMQSMQSGFFSFPQKMFGWVGSGGDGGGSKGSEKK